MDVAALAFAKYRAQPRGQAEIQVLAVEREVESDGDDLVLVAELRLRLQQRAGRAQVDEHRRSLLTRTAAHRCEDASIDARRLADPDARDFGRIGKMQIRKRRVAHLQNAGAESEGAFTREHAHDELF